MNGSGIEGRWIGLATSITIFKIALLFLYDHSTVAMCPASVGNVLSLLCLDVDNTGTGNKSGSIKFRQRTEHSEDITAALFRDSLLHSGRD